MTKAEKRIDDVLNGIVLTIKRLVKERDEAKDELEKAQKRIPFLEEAVEAHQNHIDELQAVVERVNNRIADLSHNENILIPAEKYELDVLRRLAPLKPNYAQIVDDDEEALEDA